MRLLEGLMFFDYGGCKVLWVNVYSILIEEFFIFDMLKYYYKNILVLVFNNLFI